MKRFTVLSIVLVLVLIIAAPAHAGVFGKIGDWLKGEVLVYALTALLLLFAGVSGVLFGKIVTTLKEAGEFLTVLGIAIEDKKISKDELHSIVKEAKDVFNPWRKTPDQYKADAWAMSRKKIPAAGGRKKRTGGF